MDAPIDANGSAEARKTVTRVAVVVDVGNTRSSIALLCNHRVASVVHLPTAQVREEAVVRTLRRLPGLDQAAGAVVGSVVPSTDAVWTASLLRTIRRAPLFVSPRLHLGIRLGYPKPATLGADRIANAAAVIGEGFPLPAVVADFGTAATFDVIREDASFVGGVIAPGPALMLEYLAERTALLPRLSWPGRASRWIGRSTTGAMRLGARVGYRGLVDAITQHLLRGLGTERVTLLATGGYAAQVLKETPWQYQIVPDLTLKGLAWILDWNMEPKEGRRPVGGGT